MGVEKGIFAGLVFLAVFGLVAKAYWTFPLSIIGFFVGRWLSKVDDQYVSILAAYLREEHVYDATTRPGDYSINRPKGWGRGLPR